MMLPLELSWWKVYVTVLSAAHAVTVVSIITSSVTAALRIASNLMVVGAKKFSMLNLVIVVLLKISFNGKAGTL